MFDNVSINSNKLSKFDNITQRKAIFVTGSSMIMTSETLAFITSLMDLIKMMMAFIMCPVT